MDLEQQRKDDLVNDLKRELRNAPYKGQPDYVRGYEAGLEYALRTAQSIFPGT